MEDKNLEIAILIQDSNLRNATNNNLLYRCSTFFNDLQISSITSKFCTVLKNDNILQRLKFSNFNLDELFITLLDTSASDKITALIQI